MQLKLELDVRCSRCGSTASASLILTDAPFSVGLDAYRVSDADAHGWCDHRWVADLTEKPTDE